MGNWWRQGRVAVTASVLVGWRQVRHAWRLLLVAGAGVLVAVLLVLLAPVYSYQELQAGLNAALARSDTHTINANAQLALNVSTQVNVVQFNLRNYNSTDQTLRELMQQQVGGYLQPQTEHSLVVSNIDLFTSTRLTGEHYLRLTGAAIPEVAPDLTLVQGRLPQSESTALEAAIPATAATELHLTVGDTFTVPFGTFGNAEPTQLVIQIVGIYQVPRATTKPFLQENDLQVERESGLGGIRASFYPMLVAQDSLLINLTDPLIQDALAARGTTITLGWVFHPDLHTIDIDHLGAIASSFTNLAQLINQDLGVSAAQPFDVAGVLISPNSPLQIYAAQVQVAAIPIVILLLDIVGLLLFFITMIAALLIDGQADTIAQLRSRGFSRAQLFGAYLLQSLGVGIGALALGVAIAVPVETLLLPHLLPAAASPLTLAQGLNRSLIYALLVGGFAIVTLWLSIITALQGDVLAVRREASRTTRQPLWQRLYLDLALVLVLLVVFGIATYALQATTDPQTLTLLMPLSLIAPTFLVVAGLLLLLRVLPWLFRQMARLTARSRDAVPFLASLQLARTPQTILRLLLVFALTVAFSVYVFIFAASQDAHIFDVGAQQVGADIVGNVPTQSQAATGTPAQITQRFRALPDVTAATVGYEDFGNPIVASNTSEINTIILDTDTYVHTAIWPGQTSAESIQHLLQQLSARRQTAITADTVPALVDASAWNAFHLTTGAIFHLNMSGYADTASMRFVALAEVPTIPATEATEAGILVDYQTFSAVRQHDTKLAPIPPSMVWLRLSDNAPSLRSLYAALNSPQTKLTKYTDRRVIDAQLRADPLAALITHLLTLGLVAPLVLAFIGNLLAIWTQMRGQVVLFALVRALGMVPAQVRNLLAWELGMMQALAVALGCLFGWLLAVTLTPALVFTTTTPEQFKTPLAFYVLQTVLPVRIVVPPLVLGIIALLAGLTLAMVAIGVIGLRRLTISQTLRLNED